MIAAILLASLITVPIKVLGLMIIFNREGMLNRFLVDPRLTSLIPRKRGPIQGGSRLSADIDQLVDEVIESVFLTRQRPQLADLVTEIRQRCRAAS